jgi:hypothetical protein
MVGIKQNLQLDMFSSAEKIIIEKLSESWQINFSKKVTFKKSEYSFLLVRGSERISQEFHLSREILILIIDDKFIPRCLDFVDKTMEDYHNRLDKLCVILICNDADLENKITRIIQQDKETRIIIPFSYNEILNYTDNIEEFQIRKLKKHFYERDLFAYETPLKTDIYFYGRENIIQNLYGKYNSGQCATLFGLRRIGKTSSLYAIFRLMDMREEPYVYIDCSEPSFHKRRWNESLFLIIEELHKKVLNSSKCGITKDESLYTEKNASRLFEDDLRKIFNAKGKKRILIVLDEIENITFDISPSLHWKDDLDFIYFWQVLRSVFQKEQDLLSITIAGVNPKAIETPIISGYDNPIYRYMNITYLPFFDSKEVREMITSIGLYMGMDFDEEIFTYLTDDFGGHPFIIRQICSKLFNEIKNNSSNNNKHISKYFYEERRESLTKSIYDYLDLIIIILKDKYPLEYELLEHLAEDDTKTFDEYANESIEIIEHLLGYGLIKKNSSTYHFKIKSIKPYIKEKSSINSIPRTMAAKWSKISEKRNSLETDLRLLIKQVLRINYGIEEGKKKFLAILSNKSKYENISFNDMFKSHLYFEDLRKIIEKEWQIFDKIFNKDKTIFSRHMEIINSHRSDAHANEIDDSTMGLVLSSIQWMDNKTKEYVD